MHDMFNTKQRVGDGKPKLDSGSVTYTVRCEGTYDNPSPPPKSPPKSLKPKWYKRAGIRHVCVIVIFIVFILVSVLIDLVELVIAIFKTIRYFNYDTPRFVKEVYRTLFNKFD